MTPIGAWDDMPSTLPTAAAAGPAGTFTVSRMGRPMDRKHYDDDHLVNGSKTFITNGINADLVITAVQTGTDATDRRGGITLLVLERGMPGFERGRNLDKLGLHSQDTAELSFTDVRVPVANRLG